MYFYLLFLLTKLYIKYNKFIYSENKIMKKSFKLKLKELKIAILHRVIDCAEVVKSVFIGKKPRI